MPMNALGLILGLALARKEGVESDKIGPIALVGGVMPNPAMGAVVVDLMARREAAAEAQTQITPAPVPGKGNGAVAGIAAPATNGTVAPPATDPLPQPWSLPAVEVVEPPPEPVYEPGDVLHADPGLWHDLPEGLEPRYQWFRDGHEIEGEEGNTADYALKSRDEGHALTVQVSYGGVSTTSTAIEIPAHPGSSSGKASRGSADT